MDLAVAKKFIQENTGCLFPVIADAETANRYYAVKNDILFKPKNNDEENQSVLRNADNRVCNSFYPLMVDQKAAYMFTSPPLFDIGSKDGNKKIKKILGDKYAKSCKRLCIKASNCGVAYIHYWIDARGDFKWGIIDGTQIIPVYSDGLDEELCAVLRTYTKLSEDDGKTYVIYEFWNDTECEAFKYEQSIGLDGLMYHNAFSSGLFPEHKEHRYKHSFSKVPFIPFYNNDSHTTDLKRIKGLVDTYDKNYNGLANDLEDIQEVILILTGYSGTDKAEFLKDIKKYKVIKIDDSESGSVNTLNIEIPIEARTTMLEMTRKAIFTQGQGVDPEREDFSNASGVALEFIYSLLELKAGLMQTEFMLGFGEFIRAICEHERIAVNDDIIQTWTRTAIRNDKENAEIASKSVGIISRKTNIKNHPFVENPDKELEEIEKELAEEEY